MGRRGDHSFDELSNMILDAAKDILIKDGYHMVSTRKIANQIGYSVGTLYNVYQNLDDIFLHLNGRALEELANILKESSDNIEGVIGLKKLARAYIKFSIEHFNTWSLLFEYSFPNDLKVPAWYAKKIEGVFVIIEKKLNAVVNLQDADALKNCITMLWAGIHGICALSAKGKFSRAGISADQGILLGDSFIDNFITGIANSKS